MKKNQKNVLKKNKSITPFICSLIGLVVEIIMRALTGTMVGLFNLSYLSFAGWTSLIMIPVYFLGFYSIMELHDKTKLNMRWKTILGGFMIGIIELVSGIILNIFPFHLSVWHYESFHILHQVTLVNYMLFTLSIPFAIWLSDFVDFALYDDYELKYGVFRNYKKLFQK